MTTTNHWATCDSPLGMLTLRASEHGLTELSFPGRGATGRPPDPSEPAHARDRGERPTILAEAIKQLEQYFAGARTAFDLRLDPSVGTAFQRAVWAQLERIPCGATDSYGELARRIGRPRAARAVGTAVGRTPVPIVIPCHRAVGSNGELTGYRGGLQRKRALLDLERQITRGLSFRAVNHRRRGSPLLAGDLPSGRVQPVPEVDVCDRQNESGQLPLVVVTGSLFPDLV